MIYGIGLKHFRYIEALARYRSFARAAEAIHLTQPALSRSLQSMENQLGVRLFDRKKNDITPTCYGKLVLDFGKKMLSDANKLERELEILKGSKSGELAIGAHIYTVDTLFAPAVSRLSEQFPKLTIRSMIGELDLLYQSLCEGEIELFLAYQTSVCTNDELEQIPLSVQPMVFVCRQDHPQLQFSDLHMHQLQSYPFVSGCMSSLLENMGNADQPQADLIRRWIESSVSIDCDDLYTVKSLVLNSNAISFWPLSSLSQGFGDGQIVELPVTDGPKITANFGVVRMKRRILSPSAERFMTLLQQKFQPDLV